jgi:hypothetical protein
MAKTPDVMEALAKSCVAISDSVLAADSGVAFAKPGKQFQLHLQVSLGES